MPARLSPSRRNRIVALRLQGSGRNEIERKIHEVRGSVTRELERFAKFYEQQGWKHAGDEYKVTEKLESLIAIAELAHNRNLDTEQLADGAEVAEALKKNKIEDPRDASRFLNSVLKSGREIGYDHRKLIGRCSDIDRLTSEYGDYDDISCSGNPRASN